MVGARMGATGMDGDRHRWDVRHREAGPARVGPPAGLVESGAPVPSTGRALDAACGRGATTVWAALAGASVVALDVSPVAVAATRALATAHGVADRLDVRAHDLDRGLPPGLGRFDLVVCQWYRDPGLWPTLIDHTATGGIVAVSVLSVVGAADPGPYHAPEAELLNAFGINGVEVIYYREADGAATVVAARRG